MLETASAAWPNLVPAPGGLWAAYASAGSVKLRWLGSDGGVRDVMSTPVSGTHRLMLASEGNEWAFGLQQTTGGPLTCFSSRNDGGVVVGSPSEYFGVAVSALGGVAIAAGTTGSALLVGVATSGCPSALTNWPVPSNMNENVAVVHLPGQGEEGFRFVTSGNFNFCNGAMSLYGTLDAGVSGYAPLNSVVTGDLAAVVSSSGTDVVVAQGEADCFDNYVVTSRAFPSNLGTPGMSTASTGAAHYQWNIGACGPGCTAVVSTPGFDSTLRPPPHVSVLLHTDDGNLRPLGADAGWDVECNVAVDATQAAVAYDGRLVFMIGDATQLRLIRCDLPPL